MYDLIIVIHCNFEKKDHNVFVQNENLCWLGLECCHMHINIAERLSLFTMLKMKKKKSEEDRICTLRYS